MKPVTFKYEELVKMKQCGAAPCDVLEYLKAEADKILALPTVKVTARKLHSHLGGIHDYMSMGIYWWPNPDTPDGLPYIRRDGVVNPDTKDSNSPAAVFSRVYTMALATFWFDEPKYAEYAKRQLYDWYINPETYMTPHARFAQAIPGICEGRGTGLIDFHVLYRLFDGMAILDALGYLDEELLWGIRDWYNSFTDWMLTHENGLVECNDVDNHGSWYDCQILASAIFLERPELIRNISETAYFRRLEMHISADGSQPQELKRTKAMNYSLFDLTAMWLIGEMAYDKGYKKYFEPDEKRGCVLLLSALDFIYPYVMNPDAFPYEELHPEDAKPTVARLLYLAERRFPGRGYGKLAEELYKPNMTWRLLP